MMPFPFTRTLLIFMQYFRLKNRFTHILAQVICALPACFWRVSGKLKWPRSSA